MELSMAVFCFENLLTLFYAYSGRFTKNDDKNDILILYKFVNAKLKKGRN